MAATVTAPARRAGPNDEYVDLKKIVLARGLMEKRPSHYITHALSLTALIAVITAAMVLTSSIWVHMIAAVLAALLFGQLGFIAHDSAHGQVFRSARKNYWLSTLLFNLALGGSRGWWADKHNKHHGNPNHLVLDPDTEFAVVALAPQQATSAHGVPRVAMRIQSGTLIPLLSLEALNILYHSIRFLARGQVRNGILEAVMLVIHYVTLVGALVILLGLGEGLLFLGVQLTVLGLYLSLAFLTNHVGMRVVDAGETLDFLRSQVLTARNIKRSRIADVMFGALTCQIEHHLFPAMPRQNLRRAAPMVRDFCIAHGVDYRETGVFEAYAEVARYIAAMGRLTKGDPAIA